MANGTWTRLGVLTGISLAVAGWGCSSGDKSSSGKGGAGGTPGDTGGLTQANTGGTTREGGASTNLGGSAARELSGGQPSTTGGMGGVGGQALGGGVSGGTSGTTIEGRGGATSGGTAAGGTASVASGGVASLGGAGGVNTGGIGGGTESSEPIAEVLDINDVWSGHPMEFSLLTSGTSQLVAYYDADRWMTVAMRTLGTSTWKKVKLPTQTNWDSHCNTTIGIDALRNIHVSGNMHKEPLIYFRTTRPTDITSLAHVASMVGTGEQSVSYPSFFSDSVGNLLFTYRDGVSGAGNTIFNRYDTDTRLWARLLSTSLLDGEGVRNAYPVGPTKGPDGNWHFVWVWRDTAEAETNHDLSYARSSNLIDWVAGNGKALQLPITLRTSDIADPVPIKAGMINNNTKVGFDAQNRPIVSYHKYDADGFTQIYNARLENGRWITYRTTDWTYRWEFSGINTIEFEIELDGVRTLPSGTLVQDFYHKLYGRGTLRLDPQTLHAEQMLVPPLTPYPTSLDTPQSTTPEMVVRWAKDSGESPDPAIKYMLRWETLPSNRDQPRAEIPHPTVLRLYGFRASAAVKM